MPTMLDQPEFLKVLPNRLAPVSGQMDIFPGFAASLEAPFNRVRHIEYSFGIPQNDLLAESWAFFLEVDDSEAFVRELIVPKAQMIGSHIASEKIGDIAGQILGNLSMRRRMAGLHPLLFDSPEEAANAGAAFGAEIGNEIGSSMGEQQGMQSYDFEGYRLYVSDLVLYARQMREIRAEQLGAQRVRRIPLTGEPTLRIMLANIISGVQSGNLDGLLKESFLNGADSGDMPMLAKENFILVLDKEHILIVPGDRGVLSASVKKWRDFMKRNGASDSSADNADKGWRAERNAIYSAMADGNSQILRSASLFSLTATQYTMNFARQRYGLQVPRFIDSLVPATLPTPLFISTNSENAGYLYSAFPNEFLRFVVREKLQKKGGIEERKN